MEIGIVGVLRRYFEKRPHGRALITPELQALKSNVRAWPNWPRRNWASRVLPREV